MMLTIMNRVVYKELTEGKVEEEAQKEYETLIGASAMKHCETRNPWATKRLRRPTWRRCSIAWQKKKN